MPSLETKTPEWVARLAGFEPTTPWFVAKYSIQLSYSRTQKRNYSEAVFKKEAFSTGKSLLPLHSNAVLRPPDEPHRARFLRRGKLMV
jgi:hypothetical protein